MPDRIFRRFVAFEKVDGDLREVWGDATVEEIDKQGEIVAFAGAVKAFSENADYFHKASKGKSKGNVRAMHQPIAAGRIVAWEADEKRKAIPIGTKIDDQAEWEKCKAGTYIGFSIAGVPTVEHREKIDGREVNVIDEFDLVEVSLVDHPACPSAVFSIVKRAEPAASGSPSVPGTAPASALPAEPGPSEKAEKEPTTVQTLIFDKDKFSVEEAKKWARDHDFKAGKVDEPESGDTIRIRQRDPGDFKDDMRTIELKDGVKAVIGHLKLAQPRFGKLIKIAFAELKKQGSEWPSIMPVLCALRDLQSAMDSEAFEIAMGDGDAAEEQADLRVLHDAVQSILDFLSGEFEEEILSWTSGEVQPQAGGFAMLDRLTSMKRALSPLQLLKVMDDEGMKENLDAIHRMGHGLVKASAEMGSDCPDGDCEGEDKGSEGDAVGMDGQAEGAGGKKEGEKSAAVPQRGTPAVRVRAGEDKVIRAVEKVGCEVGSVKEIVKQLDARFGKIESLPAGIGRAPTTTPAEKVLGAGAGVVRAGDLVGELNKMAEAERDPMLRQKLALRATELTIRVAQGT